MESAPEELVTATGILQAPPAEFIPPHLHGKPVLGMFVLYIGQPDEGGAVVAPSELGPPAVDLVAPMPYTAFQAMIDPFAPRGMLNYHRGSISRLPDEPSTPMWTSGPRSPGCRARRPRPSSSVMAAP